MCQAEKKSLTKVVELDIKVVSLQFFSQEELVEVSGFVAWLTFGLHQAVFRTELNPGWPCACKCPSYCIISTESLY